MSKIRKQIIRGVKKNSKPFIKAAMRSGADNIGNRLLDAVSDVNQPSEILLKKILTALKTGAIATGQEMVSWKSNRR